MRRVPVTIVTGFLGSGKTTLINRALASGRFGRVAALVNDFGALDIDAALVATVADEVVTLQNGCVCCTINEDLRRSVEQVLALDPPIDRIVVETTGVADPLPVALTFLETGLAAACALEAIVTVVDSANFVLDLFKADAAMAQIRHGDIIVLNKADLATAEQRAAVRRRIATLKPRAAVFEAVQAGVPLDALLSSAREPGLFGADEDDPHHHGHSHHLADDGFVAHGFALAGPIAGDALQAWLDQGFPPAVYRAKGIIDFVGSPVQYLFQYCGGRANFTEFDGPTMAPRLVFIGQGLERSTLEAKVAALRVPDVALA